MNTKAWICAIITYTIITISLIYAFDYCWPQKKVATTVVPFVVSGLITHLIRKLYDYIYEFFNRQSIDTHLGISIKVEHTSRKMTGYGISEGSVIQAGQFKANYEVEAELTITIQNESPNTIYKVEVSYIPNQYTQKYTLTDTRDNKLQPLEGDKHFDFKLRIMNEYFDKYAQDVDNEFGRRIIKVGKGVSFLNGSKIYIKYMDSKHKEHLVTKLVE